MSERFSAAWLALRAPYDAAARSAALARRFAALLPDGALAVDLACGTGANARYLAQHAGCRWRLVDHDRALLDRTALMPGAETIAADLRADWTAALDGAAGVTAAAFADLVSAAWLDRMFEVLAARGLPVLIALSVDGRHELTPADEDDHTVFAAFARDQRRDKGFGSALGPDAPAALLAAAQRVGYSASAEASDWIIPSTDRAMLTAMIEGVADAAARAAPDARILRWRERRRAQIDLGALALMVGHQDVLAWPAPSRRA